MGVVISDVTVLWGVLGDCAQAEGQHSPWVPHADLCALRPEDTYPAPGPGEPLAEAQLSRHILGGNI